MANPWGLLHMIGECDSCHKQVRIRLRSAVKGGEGDKWMVQALAICEKCGLRIGQSEWMEMPTLGQEMEVFAAAAEEVRDG